MIGRYFNGLKYTLIKQLLGELRYHIYAPDVDRCIIRPRGKAEARRLRKQQDNPKR